MASSQVISFRLQIARYPSGYLVGSRAFFPAFSPEEPEPPLPRTPPKNDLTTPMGAGVPCSSDVKAKGDEVDEEW